MSQPLPCPSPKGEGFFEPISPSEKPLPLGGGVGEGFRYLAIPGAACLAAAVALAALNPDLVAKNLERAQRLPTPVLAAPDRTSLAVAGGKLERLALNAKLGAAHPLPTGSPIQAIVPWGTQLAVASFDDGAWLVDGDRALPLDLGTAVNDLAAGRDGWLFAATNDGAFRVGHDGQVEKLAPGAWSAVCTWRGQPWFASKGGIATVDARGFVTFGAERGLVPLHPAALADCGPELCIGAEDGLWLFDGTQATRRSSGSGDLPADEVTAVAFDGRSVWAGTFDAGFGRLRVAPRRMATPDGLTDGRIEPRAMTAWKGLLLAGTPSGIEVVRGEGTAHLGVAVPGREVTALASDAQGLWVGYRGGIARLEVKAP